jgi:hypothetical protein
MRKKMNLIPVQLILIAVFLVPFFGGCSKAYYGAMEKVGIHKRDILVDRVEGARDAQSEAQEQFKSALEQFGTVIHEIELIPIAFPEPKSSMDLN